MSIDRSVLAAASDYFKKLCLSKQYESKIYINSKIFQLIVDFSYTGDIIVTDENVIVLLDASTTYEFIEIKKKIMQFLRYSLKINPIKAIEFHKLACPYNLDELKSLCMKIAAFHFKELKESHEFLELEFDTLLQIIQNDDLNVPSKEYLHNAVKEWLKKDQGSRNVYISKLIQLKAFDVSVSLN